ncbi:Hypothetical_protein [Hexamita inflata]|uniref:Hypothetical_protein n=1 Tax=Hexamita inflata TaxID=28002 RepID=A0AA86U2D6_9EUKA|nr:Hypothetical protein HINF_LOCUS25424 [Hexamita inflata]
MLFNFNQQKAYKLYTKKYKSIQFQRWKISRPKWMKNCSFYKCLSEQNEVISVHDSTFMKKLFLSLLKVETSMLWNNINGQYCSASVRFLSFSYFRLKLYYLFT